MKLISRILLLPLALSVSLPSQSAAAERPEEISRAIRNNDLVRLGQLIRSAEDANQTDEFGKPPLHRAVLVADAPLIEFLLDKGADPNKPDGSGSTPLICSASRPEIARLLLRRGADPLQKSALGNTALITAARVPGSAPLLRQLLERGVDPNATNVFGASALMAAAASGDTESVKLLLDHGARPVAAPRGDLEGFIGGGGRTPLMWAAFLGHPKVVELLLDRGADIHQQVPFGNALTHAAWSGQTAIARALLARGADPNSRELFSNFSALHWAASAEDDDLSLVNLLLKHGASPSAEGGQPVDAYLGVGQTPVMLALRRGNTPIVDALVSAGAARPVAAEDSAPAKQPSDRDRASIAPSIGLLQKTALRSRKSFLAHASKQNCVSCHQQYMPLAAVGLASSRGFPIDLDHAEELKKMVLADNTQMGTLFAEALFHPEPVHSIGYELLGLYLAGITNHPSIDAHVHHLAAIQDTDGSWHNNLPRPPIQTGDISATAFGIFSMKFYAPPGRREEFAARAARAADWLRASHPENNHDRALQLLGLLWAGKAKQSVAGQIQTLIDEQRSDGGWAQLSGLESDAYATGLTLYALSQAGLARTHTAVEKGLAFLGRTQETDSSWHVQRRAFPFQPTMDSGFPHGRDSWISATATAWAVMAIAACTDSHEPTAETASARADLSNPASLPEPASGTVEFERDIRPLLAASCIDCHSGERPRGGLDLANRDSALRGGASGSPAILPGESAESMVVRLVAGLEPDMEMPPLAKREKFPALDAGQISLIRAWIDQGARW